MIAKIQRTWMKLGKSAESWLSTVRIPKLARTGKFGLGGFFFHRARRILFRQDEKEWGVQAQPASWQEAKRTGPFGPALLRRKQEKALFLRLHQGDVQLVQLLLRVPQKAGLLGDT